jgi:hypothetical protein
MKKKRQSNVFVDMAKEKSSPEYHIVPSEIVAETLKEKHKEYIRKNGEKENDKGMRPFHREYIGNKYLNKWDLLRR